MRSTTTLTLVLLALGATLTGAGAALAAPSRRARCGFYRCTTLAQDRLVRLVRAETREEAQHEEIQPHPRYWVVWKPTGRRRALPGLDPSPSRVAVAGRWLAWAEFGCDYESSECGVGVERIDADSGRHDSNPLGGPRYVEEAGRLGQAQRPGEPCFTYTTTGEQGVTALVLSATGTTAWIQLHTVCEMPYGSTVPVVLAEGPEIAPSYLRLAGGRIYWKEEALHSAALG